MSSLTRSPAWQALRAHHATMAGANIAQLFASDAKRFELFSVRCGGLLLDCSKNLISPETIRLLATLARTRGVGDRIQHLFNGGKVNTSENRPALHTALRNDRPVVVDGADILPDIQATLKRMRIFSEGVQSGAIAGSSGRKFTDVINIGIGGSHFGPALAVDALAPYADRGLRVHFVSNIDVAALNRTLAPLNAETTLIVVSSKSFTTAETLANAHAVRDWLRQEIRDNDVSAHMVAVTANVQLATGFGIPEERVLPMWDWVGGRYSVWSAVGLPVVLAVGMDNFERLLAGAREMDAHFRNAPFEKSMPVLLALLGIWYNNFFGASSHAILPYGQSLKLLPAYLQQLDMESSGKRITTDGEVVDYDTGAVIWGAPGTDAQHSFFQLLHQGTRLIPADFIAACQPHHAIEQHHEILMANFFAQTAALMNGETGAAAHEHCPGNRPTNSILIEKLTPHTLGQLLALYEHKVFVQNVVWGLNAYDQPGVEVGKRLAARILPELDDAEPVASHDASTGGLIDFYKANRDDRSRSD